MSEPRSGLLLVNLGTPESAAESDVRRYLGEFLADPRVLDMPAIPRSLLLNLVILPFRPQRSAEAYAKVFSERGSPLLYHSEDLAEKVRTRLGPGVQVELAMRYGKPDLAGAFERFSRARIDRIVVFPLYPQYASSTTGSTIEAVNTIVSKRWVTPYLQMIPAFYDHPAFIEAVAARARPLLATGNYQKVLFSFHGLPERHLRKGNEAGRCLERSDCCAEIGPMNRGCYRAQCVATMRAVGLSLGLKESEQVLCFQSRLGRDPWIQPYTDQVLTDLRNHGITRVALLSPAFVADCLETLEELGMVARASFLAAGGEAFDLVENLNASDRWADAVVEIARDHTRWLDA